MLPTETLQRADLFFRTYLHTTIPLHACLVDQLCRADHPPLELATVLEDIGQSYLALAQDLNNALVRSDRLMLEPDADNSLEVQIDSFVSSLTAGAARLTLQNGRAIDGPAAMSAAPFVADAIRVALLKAYSQPDPTITVSAAPCDTALPS